MMKKLPGLIAALLVVVLAAGCAGQAGSEASTPALVATPAVAESPVEATEPITATEPVTGATPEMPEQRAAAQAWPVLWDPEIGFEVRYPPGWLIGEAEVTDKDAPITRVYTLQPADWAEDYAPVIVEVSQGTEEAFRRMYLEPAATEERSIGPLTYTYETSGSEGSLENYAIFTSAEDPELRVAVRDTVTGFPDRASAHAELGGLIEEIVASFRWRK